MKQFTSLFFLVLAFSVTLGQSQADLNPVAIPFFVNQTEITGARFVSSSVERVNLGETKSVKEYISANAVSLVFLFDTDNELVAMDLVIAGLKETLNFNAFNSAKADVASTFAMMGIPPELQVKLYWRIDSHPQFPALVKEYADAKGLPQTDSASTLSVDIALALAREFKAELESQE